MNKEKLTSYTKLLVTFLVAVILVFTFGLVADGWQEANPPSPDTEDGGTPPDDDTADGESTETGGEPVVVPKYYDRLTGLECDKDASERRHFAFLLHSNLPFYAVADADMLIEFPTEDGETRLLVFTGDFSKYGKIGTLAKTRSYISIIADNFDAILTSLGADDDSKPSGVDLSRIENSYYTEYTHYAYTNSSLLSSAMAELSINTKAEGYINLPFIYNEEKNGITARGITALNISIPYSISQGVSLSYSEITGKYTYEKGALPKRDNLTGEFIATDNIFILFADSVTYEDKSGESMSLDTIGGGEGYYAFGGKAAKILWSTTDDGLKFTDENGVPLIVSPGKSYIAFVKSSKTDEVSFS